MIVKRYSEDPNKYWPLIEKFRLQTFDEGNDSLTRKKYNPDNEDIETWMCFKDDKLISISAAEKSHYTNDPDIAVRVCRYHILKEHRFTHCGLIMAEYQIKWAKENNFKILYITHDIKNKAINNLYQRKRKMTDKAFKDYIKGEWYTKLQLENKFLFKTGKMLQYVYSIRLQDDNFKWQPKSDYIIEREHNGQIN
ncbi:MAG: hypothetical protein CBD57_03280 [Candidatus Pelagibacter sp. TMED197]|jgi:hypothetical protein|nr:MAG: hypothetical protein CBD57_03280 [Candidatus Pelagibacter sp. TMED197]|tara:strand:- start:336 stop:920 length:585 start_codon:yes stop_codon:yes gene_type:complete